MKDVKSKMNKGICQISTLFLQLSYNSKIMCKNFLKETKNKKRPTIPSEEVDQF